MRAGDLTTWLVAATPGLILGLLVAVLRVDLTVHLSWLAVPAMLLVALTTTTVGFAIAHAATPPVTNMATQLIVFIDRPDVLPDQLPARPAPAMATSDPTGTPLRVHGTSDTLTTPHDGIAILPFAVLAAWTAAVAPPRLPENLRHRCHPLRAATAHRSQGLRTLHSGYHDGYAAIYPENVIAHHRAFIAAAGTNGPVNQFG